MPAEEDELPQRQEQGGSSEVSRLWTSFTIWTACYKVGLTKT